VNFALDETQEALAGLAAQVAAGHGGHERAEQVEAGDGIDHAAWSALGSTGLLAAVASGDGGVVGACEIATALDRDVVSLPAYALLTPLLVLSEDDSALDGVLDGGNFVTLALSEAGSYDVSRAGAAVDASGALSGRKVLVPGLMQARAALVAAQGTPGPGLFLVELDQPGVERLPVSATDRLSAGHLVLSGARARQVADAAGLARAEQIASVLVCASVIGLSKRAAERAAAYITERQQFGRPIASFQSPVLKLADAHMDTEAMRVTAQQAAWLLDAGGDPGRIANAVAVAKWWTANGGHRTLHTAQHLHGGIGADISYPAHRYFLRGKQLLDVLGGAAAQASRLGASIAAEARA
jgi:acyl-CoA dehydrogenase